MVNNFSSLVKDVFETDEYTEDPEKLCEILKKFTISEILELLKDKNLVFIHTHFWSECDKSWIRSFPMYFCRDGDEARVKEDVLSFFIFFLLRAKRFLTKFSLTSFIFQDLPQKPFITFERIAKNMFKHTEDVAKIEMLHSQDKMVRNIKLLIPEINMEDERQRVKEDKELITNIQGFMNNACFEKVENKKGWFVPSKEFDEIVKRAIESKKGKELAERFAKRLEEGKLKDIINKLYESITQEMKKKSLPKEWNFKKDVLTNFLKVAIAHNLLSEWKYLYILPSKIFKEKGIEKGFGGPYICSCYQIEEEILDDLYIRTNLKYRSLSAQDLAKKAKSATWMEDYSILGHVTRIHREFIKRELKRQKKLKPIFELFCVIDSLLELSYLLRFKQFIPSGKGIEDIVREEVEKIKEERSRFQTLSDTWGRLRFFPFKKSELKEILDYYGKVYGQKDYIITKAKRESEDSYYFISGRAFIGILNEILNNLKETNRDKSLIVEFKEGNISLISQIEKGQGMRRKGLGMRLIEEACNLFGWEVSYSPKEGRLLIKIKSFETLYREIKRKGVEFPEWEDIKWEI
jgi:hypothetical protein